MRCATCTEEMRNRSHLVGDLDAEIEHAFGELEGIEETRVAARRSAHGDRLRVTDNTIECEHVGRLGAWVVRDTGGRAGT